MLELMSLVKIINNVNCINFLRIIFFEIWNYKCKERILI